MRFLFIAAIFLNFAVIPFGAGCSDYTEYVPIERIVERGDHILRENPDLQNRISLDIWIRFKLLNAQ